MDIASIICLSAALLKGFVSYVFYKKYRKHAKCLAALEGAKCLNLDDDLKKIVEKYNGEIKYAVISGKIQALTAPLTSNYIPSGITQRHGVIRENTIWEQKWDPISNIWKSTNKKLLQYVKCVPFALCGKTNLFKKTVSVEIIEPLTAEELSIPTVYEDLFCRNDYVIGAAAFSEIRGENLLGIQVVEKLLYEGETLTAIGKLTVENNSLKIEPPDEGLTYFLTPLSLETLIDKVKSSANTFKVITIINVALTLALLMYISRHVLIRQQRVVRDRIRKELRRRQKQTMSNESIRPQDVNHVHNCIVCVTNPIQVVILECGHASLCSDCAPLIRGSCPICRNPITRKVRCYLS